ncbi:MAG: hypothetical protein Q8J97_16870, partial [Flavobacteriaceae bacterium]|nr:hypothetical protein [Flavobacteriaceae bacterium]
NGEGSDALFTGAVDGTQLTCEGDPARCLIIPRRRGKIVVPTRDGQPGGNVARRSLERETTNQSDYDEGILINKMRKRGRVGDYIRIDGVAGTARDFGGPFTVSAWVQVTGDTRGFLIAKVDTAFYADGRSPVLDRAAFDAQDRHVPHDALELPRYAHRLYFGVFVNGPKKRVDVLLTRDDGVVAIRHFRLGDLADTLFDGTWRFLTLDLTVNSIGEIQGVAYVDGQTQRTDPGLVQCFPFLPAAIGPQPNGTLAASPDELVATLKPGASLVVGYGFEGALDEVRLYAKSVDHVTIVAMGGDEFLGALFFNARTLLIVAVFGAVALVVAVPIVLYRRHRRRVDKKQQEEAAARRRLQKMLSPGGG